MTIRDLSTAAFIVSVLASASQGADEKTRAKMLKDGAKKLTSAKAEEREEGMESIVGYIACGDRQQYLPVLLKALKDQDPKVRARAALGIEKLQAAEAVPDLVAALEDANVDVRTRAAFALGGMGKAAQGAVPALQKAQARAKSAHNEDDEGSMTSALNEISGKTPPNRFHCP